MSIINILEKKLDDASGNSEVLSISELCESGICGSASSAKKLIKDSGISSIRIGNRTLFSKSDLISFLQENSSSKRTN